jgi:hypothetical protein
MALTMVCLRFRENKRASFQLIALSVLIMRKELKQSKWECRSFRFGFYLFYFVITTQKCSSTGFEHVKILFLEFFSSPFWCYISMVISINFLYLSFGTNAALSMYHVLVFPNLILYIVLFPLLFIYCWLFLVINDGIFSKTSRLRRRIHRKGIYLALNGQKHSLLTTTIMGLDKWASA